MTFRSICGSVLFCFGFSALSIAGPTSYSVKELGANQFVMGINDRGEVLAGGPYDSSPTFLYQANGKVIELSDLSALDVVCDYGPSAGPLYVAATAINNRGFVLMNVYGPQSSVSLDGDCIVVYHDGSLVLKRTLGSSAYASGINDRNQIIGIDTNADNEVVGFGPRCDFDRSGSIITPNGINDRGQIAGTSANGAQLCTDGVWRPLPLFPGTLGPMSATAINNRGDVAGSADVPIDPTNSASHGFFYSRGRTIDIGTLSPSSSVYPESMNDKGQIVGAGYNQSGSTTFLYQEGKIYDLMTLISTDDPLNGLIRLEGGSVINDEGVIAANGTDLRTGVTHVYVFIPCPAKTSGP
jgi:probable HAF family extracellular repeat protein